MGVQIISGCACLQGVKPPALACDHISITPVGGAAVNLHVASADTLVACLMQLSMLCMYRIKLEMAVHALVPTKVLPSSYLHEQYGGSNVTTASVQHCDALRASGQAAHLCRCSCSFMLLAELLSNEQ
jgi:hypothetical protein